MRVGGGCDDRRNYSPTFYLAVLFDKTGFGCFHTRLGWVFWKKEMEARNVCLTHIQYRRTNKLVRCRGGL